ncbi:serine/threonine-protein phosphatase 4 regulatory subunit 2-B [Alosa sapidissima]|uniref:serine/threonine-protein phosphatase 4 regulatory subunit 2-B n=1 Tax=Alosa sapidissima TaxID=34773 RepID=UPI001C0834CC|nr:serine/threonine-protein phosphatase 4 regulatory subunit 2-B [Alosa sapidissima]
MEIDTLLEALKEFEKKGKKEVSPLLEQFLCHVAKSGETLVPWSQFKSYFIFKLEKVMDDFRDSAPEQRGPPNPNVECIPFDEMKARIMKIVDGYTGIPFTIQRLCELLTEPKRNYTGTEKFLRGVEKNVMVVSCVHPTSEKNGCSGVNRMNGVMLPGNSSAFAERKVNGPGTPRPLNRQKVPLSSSLATNGLPDSTENKDPNTAGGHSKSHSESSVSGPSRGLARNKHAVKEEDEGLEEEEQPEVKRLKFLKDGEDGAEEDDEEEEDEEEDDADETAAVETLRPTLAESSSDAQQARAQSSASPEKQRDEELEEEEEDSVPASSAADCQDQEPSSTQTELCAEESKVGEKAEREAKAEREVPSSAADDDNAEEPADMDQSEQRAPSGVAGSPEGREAGEESNEHVSSSSSSSSCSEENEESAATSATPSDSTTEPPAEGTPESGTQDSAAADEPMEVD